MPDVKWIKIVTDIFDDEKMLLIDSMPEHDSIIVIWFKLLCLAGKQNNGGFFMINDKIACNDEMLSAIFRRPLNTVRLALSTFENLGMIQISENIISLPNWNKHQSLDKLEKSKEQTRKRVAKCREKKKLQMTDNTSDTSNVTVALQVTDVTHTDIDIDIDKDTDIEEEKESSINLSINLSEQEGKEDFQKPSLNDVVLYCNAKGYTFSPEKFYDYYEEKNWKKGTKNQSIVNWQEQADYWGRTENSSAISVTTTDTTATKDYTEIIKQNINYDYLVDSYGEEYTNNVVGIINDECSSSKPYAKIKGADISRATVTGVLLMADYEAILNTIDAMSKLSKIKNYKDYFISTLYTEVKEGSFRSFIEGQQADHYVSTTYK